MVLKTVTDYIEKFARESKTPEHEVILECLDFCQANGTMELTIEQVKEFDRRRENGNRIQRNGRIKQE